MNSNGYRVTGVLFWLVSSFIPNIALSLKEILYDAMSGSNFGLQHSNNCYECCSPKLLPDIAS